MVDEVENPEEEGMEEVEATQDDAATAEIARLKDQLLRALAEQENVRKRAQRDKDDAVKYAASGFAKDLLSTADNLRRALDSMKSDDAQSEAVKNLLAGVSATERELLSAFEKHGIKRIDAMGEKFDHNRHQAIMELEAPGKAAGTVVQVLQAGYTLNDRLLRPAMVGVAKAGSTGGSGDTGTAGGADPAGRVDTLA